MRFETHDKLKREIFGKKLLKIIEISDEVKEDNSYVIALDSSWGTGKTTFIDMWLNLVDETSEYNVILHNAWDNDDFNKPIISILSDILIKVDDEQIMGEKTKTEIKRKAIELTKFISKRGITFIFKDRLGFDIEELVKIVNDKANVCLDKNDVSEALDILTSNGNNAVFDEYNEFNKLKSSFKELLTKLSKDKKLIFIIDELDRCNPLYAIDMLETIKHFFNTNNIVFILAIDIEQLSHSIATIYGLNMDSTGYLKRFFDIQLRLPEPKNSDYIKYILEANNIAFTESMINELVVISNKLDMSLRDLNRVIKNMSIMLKMSNIKNYTEEYLIVYTYLMVLKYKYPEEFKTILKKKFLSTGNGGTGSYLVLDDLYYKPTETIEIFMKFIHNGATHRKLSDLIRSEPKELTMFLHDKDREAEGFDDQLPMYKFLERKLELYY